ncbi:sensor histidine kinase [Terracoccus luteus]|uniref:Signal transduction histidine-protein kinase/phosphatase MprB n=1 Tax=Terracoccus luteus TaxID=53356 RepID=A0A839Q4L0_9MICO|nr:HAMP domain-containing sensor histidine kinase [Terracoccus luteus]MBB2987571.1 two-component system sensor histidine kinase BaeS [Terracoccus luteus]MCP2173222.1 two-component system sensor histidine kinase BaeS [Terracoccus luteus]
MNRTGWRRTSLSTQVIGLAVAIAVLTATLAGVLAVGLTRSSADEAARSTLARIADGAAARADNQSTVAAQTRAVRLLGALNVESASVGRGGGIISTSRLARQALTPERRQLLLGGTAVSERQDVDGQAVLIEGRPTDAGGIILVQRRSDATAESDQLVRRVLLALLVAAAVAVAVGALLARRLSRPLRGTADAAHALAAGRRDVAVPVTGPREVAEVASALNRLTGSLTRSEGRQRDFLLSVSHDLRTPLTGIRGYAESLAEGVVPADETARVGGVMAGEARRLDRLVADLLDLARLDAQQPRVEPRLVDLVAVARDVEAVWSRRCAEVGVPFRLAVATAGVWATTDPARLRQVVDGLLENALRVTPAEAPVVLEVRPGAPGHAVVEVRDGGPGLTDDDLGVAFEPSVLHERYRGLRPVGTGLGLAIVGRLVGLLGGTVEAGHADEGGARFTVTVPA